MKKVEAVWSKHGWVTQPEGSGIHRRLHRIVVQAPGNAGKSSWVMRPPTAPPAAAQRPPDMTPPPPGAPDTEGKSAALKPCLSFAACKMQAATLTMHGQTCTKEFCDAEVTCMQLDRPQAYLWLLHVQYIGSIAVKLSVALGRLNTAAALTCSMWQCQHPQRAVMIDVSSSWLAGQEEGKFCLSRLVLLRPLCYLYANTDEACLTTIKMTLERKPIIKFMLKKHRLAPVSNR